MSEWKKVRLGEVAELIAGYAFKSKCFGDYNSKVIKITDINNEGFFCAALPGVDISQLDKKKLDKYLVKRGDYVLAMTGSIGKIGKLLDGMAYINQRVLTVKAFENTDRKYLYFCLKGKPFLEYMLTHIDSHSVQANISASTIGDFELTLPPLPTQRKIAAVLGALDDKIENNRKICANLEAQAQAIFKSWFVDLEPFGGKMPQGWKMGPLEGMAERIASGGTPRTKEESYYKGPIRWYSTKELKDCFLFDSEKHISEDAVENSAAKVFPRNTILMAIYAAPTVGRLGILDSESAFNQAAVGIVARQEIGYAYLYLQLLNAREGLNLMAVGSCQQNLNVGVVKSYQVLRPDDVILSKFNSLVDGLFDEIRALTKQSRALATMRDALLPKLMSGEIDVEKVEVA